MINNDGKMTELSTPSNSSETADLSNDYRELHVHPWTRFFAKYIDLITFSIVLEFFLIFFFPSILINDYANVTFGLLVLFLWIFVEPILLTIFGTTLGKFILRITVRDTKGNKLKIHQALSRSSIIWIVGFGFGLPIISLITLLISYYQLQKNGTTTWDKNRYIVTHAKVGKTRITIAIILILISIMINVLVPFKNIYFANEIEKLNKTLPKMMTSEIELSKVDFENNTLNYQYRFINQNVNNFNYETFENSKKIVIQEVCSNKETRLVLKSGITISYNYFDQNKISIGKLSITSSNCSD